ncbi:MAG: hypothetical protein HYX50_05900 [Chloroflexi bacterium]|nr:hypothetical protein [Chloroflexota bacterium]
MVFRRAGQREDDEVIRDAEDGLNILSGDDDEEDEDDRATLFREGDLCWVCQQEPGRIALDPTCHGSYPGGDPVLLGHNCLAPALAETYGAMEGIAAIVVPLEGARNHLYYRIDEMPAYGFPREDIEPVSWLMLGLGDACSRCGEQSHIAWLTSNFVNTSLLEEEGVAVFRNLDGDIERLCGSCAAGALAHAYAALRTPLLIAELPRSAMGILMPSGA